MGLGLLIGAGVGAALGGSIAGATGVGTILGGALAGAAGFGIGGTILDNMTGNDEDGWFGIGGTSDKSVYDGGSIGSVSEAASPVSVGGDNDKKKEDAVSVAENVGGDGSGEVDVYKSYNPSTSVKGTLSAQGQPTFGGGSGFGFTKSLGA